MPDPIQPDDVDVQGQPRLIRTFYGPTVGWKNVSGAELDLGTSGGVGDGGPAGGVEPQIQYNLGGNLQGDPQYNFDYTTNTVLLGDYGEHAGQMIKTSNPTVDGNDTHRRALHIGVKYDGSTSIPTFGNEEGIFIDFHAMHGQATNGAFMSAKKTYLPINIQAKYNASGQKFASASRINGYGMGDTATWGNNYVGYAGGPINGDEGQGWQLVANLEQQPFLNTGTITSKPAQSTYSALTTGAISGDYVEQDLPVNTTANLTVGDWVVVGQEMPHASPLLEAVQITAFGPGNTIRGIFYYNHPVGAVIKPALVLFVQSNMASFMGQDRVLVNLSGASHNTNTVASIPNNHFLGNATNWSIGMVGGDALNIGAISLAADDYTGTPFGPGAARLRSWYQITAVDNLTDLTIWSFTIAGVQSYLGNGPGAGAYEIRPCARVLRIVHSAGGNATGQIICEYSAAAWNVGNSVEQVICPYPDVTGFQYHMQHYTPAGETRSFMRINNLGAREFQRCFEIVSDGPVGAGAGAGGADLIGWGTVLDVRTRCRIGMNIDGAQEAGIRLRSNAASGFPDAGGNIQWDQGSMTIGPDSVSGGMKISAALFSGSGGLLWNAPNTAGNPSAQHYRILLNDNIEMNCQPVGQIAPYIYQYNFQNGPSIYERSFFRWIQNVAFQIGTEQAGGGSARHVDLCTDGTGRWRIAVGGDFWAFVDNTYDIGDPSDFRPRDVNVARNVTAGEGVHGGTHVSTGTMTVGALGTPFVGQRKFVTDSTLAAIGNFGQPVVGGGGTPVPVWADGANWRIG